MKSKKYCNISGHPVASKAESQSDSVSLPVVKPPCNEAACVEISNHVGWQIKQVKTHLSRTDADAAVCAS